MHRFTASRAMHPWKTEADVGQGLPEPAPYLLRFFYRDPKQFVQLHKHLSTLFATVSSEGRKRRRCVHRTSAFGSERGELFRVGRMRAFFPPSLSVSPPVGHFVSGAGGRARWKDRRAGGRAGKYAGRSMGYCWSNRARLDRSHRGGLPCCTPAVGHTTMAQTRCARTGHGAEEAVAFHLFIDMSPTSGAVRYTAAVGGGSVRN